jgi:hypothetical protein
MTQIIKTALEALAWLVAAILLLWTCADLAISPAQAQTPNPMAGLSVPEQLCVRYAAWLDVVATNRKKGLEEWRAIVLTSWTLKRDGMTDGQVMSGANLVHQLYTNPHADEYTPDEAGQEMLHGCIDYDKAHPGKELGHE